jgi:hypothetical protein
MESSKQRFPPIPDNLLIPPPLPRFFLRPNNPPPHGHPLSHILRPRYLDIVNRQLEIDIKEAEWQADLQQLFFDDKTSAITTKQVRWMELIEVCSSDESDEEEGSDYELYHKDNEAQAPESSECSILQSRSGSARLFFPAGTQREREIQLPVPSRSTSDTSPVRTEEEVTPYFPLRTSPAEAENNFSPPFPKRLAPAGAFNEQK